MLDIPADPLARFRQIYDALNADRSFFTDAGHLRFAAISAVAAPGDAATVARSIRRLADEIRAESGAFGHLSAGLRFVVAAVLLVDGDTPRGLLHEVERVRRMFRERDMRRGGPYETLAALILRKQAGGKPVDPSTVARMQKLYEGMKAHHWWLTGPDDFPACALLTNSPGEPTAICNAIETIYQELRREGFSTGDPLQSAANILYMAGKPAHESARQFRRLAEEFRAAGVRMWQSDYDELAILSFLDHKANTIVRRVVELREQVAQLHPKPDYNVTFNIGSSLAFLELVQLDSRMQRITDAKAMIDVQALITGQQTAAVAAASSAAVMVTVTS